LSREQEHGSSRADRRARLLTPGFSLRRHLATFAGLAATAAAIAIGLARRARPADLWIVPAYLVAANLAEYLVHRLLMHRPLWPRAFYRSHTLGHHRVFHHDSMEIAAWPELELVMMPWFSLAFFFVGMAPIVAAIAWAFGRGAAGLFLLTGVATFVLYEGMHALYHFPEPALRRLRVFDNRVFRFLYRHHRHHHRLQRMRRVNFNISMPLADRLFGTQETGAAWQRARDDRRRSGGAAAPVEATHHPDDDGKHAA
jgi:sterol desaturase/sphingolipid hydroxylase (fatty acid hydroxylase superfamily)